MNASDQADDLELRLMKALRLLRNLADTIDNFRGGYAGGDLDPMSLNDAQIAEVLEAAALLAKEDQPKSRKGEEDCFSQPDLVQIAKDLGKLVVIQVPPRVPTESDN